MAYPRVRIRASLACILFSAALAPSAAAASDLKFEFNNPSFGGNPFNSAHLLAVANGQNDYDDPDAIDRSDPDDPGASIEDYETTNRFSNRSWHVRGRAAVKPADGHSIKASYRYTRAVWTKDPDFRPIDAEDADPLFAQESLAFVGVDLDEAVVVIRRHVPVLRRAAGACARSAPV